MTRRKPALIDGVYNSLMRPPQGQAGRMMLVAAVGDERALLWGPSLTLLIGGDVPALGITLGLAEVRRLGDQIDRWLAEQDALRGSPGEE